MIHIHGLPTGGTVEGSIKFITDRHVMVSFADPKDLKRAQQFSRSYVLDNGAFSTWKRGEKFDAGKYISWVCEQQVFRKLRWAVIPDVIEGTEQQNDELIELWLRAGVPVQGVPVWHYNESVSRLKALCGYFETVALGSCGDAPGTHRWWDRTNQIFSTICDDEGNPPCKLHVLRMLNREIFTRIPLASADSTYAAHNGFYQQQALKLKHKWQGQLLNAWKVEAHDSPATWQPVPWNGNLFDDASGI